MNQKRYLRFSVWVAAMLFLFSASAFGGDVKTRMKDRLPKIIQLKAAGIIGETSQGFLAFVGGNTAEQDLVDAENKDRQLVYAAIAKQQGTTPERVGQRRALQIAAMAKAGEWLQNAGGEWYQK